MRVTEGPWKQNGIPVVIKEDTQLLHVGCKPPIVLYSLEDILNFHFHLLWCAVLCAVTERNRAASVLIQRLGKQRQQGAIVLNYRLEDKTKAMQI